MIKFVYFDVGGTIIKDFSETNKWQEFKKDFKITDEYWNSVEGNLSTGKTDIDEKILNGFVDRFEINSSIWPVIAKIKEHYQVGLLTNMYPGMLDLIKSHNLLPKINWDVIIDSSVEKTAKPDPKIFEIAQNRAGVPGKEILFIENSEEHVKAAEKFGWRTFWYDSKNYEDSSNKLAAFLLNESRNAS